MGTSIVNQFNNLGGGSYSRSHLKELANLAKAEGVYQVCHRIENVLDTYPNLDPIKINTISNKIIAAENSLLCGLPYFEDSEDLGKAVSPSEIYDMITNMIIELIESGKTLPWRKPWESISQYGIAASNFNSKQSYRGINSLLLNFIIPAIRQKEWDIPFFMTFDQVKRRKGKVKKDAQGYKIVYFTKLYRYKQDNADGKLNFSTYNLDKFKKWLKDNRFKISLLKGKTGRIDYGFIISRCTIPILKYYNVYNADDIEGINWGLDKLKKKKSNFKPIESAEAIAKCYPKSPPVEHKGDQAFFSPAHDKVVMPPKESFKTEQEYYGTLFHELVHSTGIRKRLDRDMSGKFGSPSYAFEELIAELGASFLNGESGILFHTVDNSASYLKGWRSRLIGKMKEDNRFFFRAASKAQAAADYILDRDNANKPAYITYLEKKEKQKKTKPVAKKRRQKPPVRKKTTARENQPKEGSDQISIEFENENIHVPDQPKKKQLHSLNGPEHIADNDSIKTPSESIANFANELGFERADTEIDNSGVFRLPGPIGEFIQDIQAHKALILIKGTAHTSKSQVAMQTANAFGERKEPVCYIDYEQGGLRSKDTQNSLKWNTTPSGKPFIFIKGEVEKPMAELEKACQVFKVIVADSVTDLKITADQLNYLRTKYPEVIWIFISQVKENGKMYGGNKMAHNPTIIIECHPCTDPKGRYATLYKNRGNNRDLKYWIYDKVVTKMTPEEVKKVMG